MLCGFPLGGEKAGRGGQNLPSFHSMVGLSLADLLTTQARAVSALTPIQKWVSQVGRFARLGGRATAEWNHLVEDLAFDRILKKIKFRTTLSRI
ncbi:MAG: hypothetical protein ACI9UK_001255 [Candidatus Krumholzibacteriia bacterium]|jgi:hypothetical protein